MKIASLSENLDVEKRIAITPEIAKKYNSLGFEVLIPKDNEKDLTDIPEKVKKDIKLTTVEMVDDVLKIALTKELKKIDWVEVEKISDGKKDDKSQASIQ